MIKTTAVAAVTALLLLILGFVSITQIDTGNVGVSRLGGKINPGEIAPGWSFTGLATVDEYTTKEILFQVNDLKPKSLDNLTMTDVDLDIYIQPSPQRVAETVAKYQGDVLRHGDIDKGSKNPSDLVAGPSRVMREAREAVFNAISQFPATTMHTRRTELAATVQKILQAELSRSDPGVWTVTGVNVRNLVTDPALEASIRQKLETDQAIDRKKKEIELTQAEAVRKEVEARGTARANEIVAASLTPALVRLKEIEAQAAFAKQGTHTVLMGGNTNALINVK
jgi:prohibitin 1